jgi:uncharacterized membrane protein YGL010W
MGKSKDNGWAITSLITGILAILPYFGLLMAVIALITGYIGQKREKQRWMAIVGMILGLFVIIVQIIAMVTGTFGRLFRSVGF